MPLAMTITGTNVIVTDLNVKEATKRHLESLGIVLGSVLTVLSKAQGNLIINVKGSRIALNQGIAQGLMVEELEACRANSSCNRNTNRHRNRRRGRCKHGLL